MIGEFEKAVVLQLKHKLQQNGFVIFPYWGAFFLEFIPAQFDERKTKLLPPCFKVLYNAHISQNDGVLAISLSAYLNISYFETLNLLKDLANQWSKMLESSRKITIESLGIFEYSGKSIFFTPIFSLEHPAVYGLQPIELNLLDSDHSIVFTFPGSSTNLSHWLKAAILIPAVVALSILPTKINRYSGGYSDAAFLHTKLNYSQKKIDNDNLEQTIDTLTTLPIALNPDVAIASTATIEDTVTKQKMSKIVNEQKSNIITTKTNSYFLIIASFTNMKQVENYCRSIKEKIKTIPIILNCDGKLRVAFNQYSTRDEANLALTEFKQQFPDYSGWILYW